MDWIGYIKIVTSLFKIAMNQIELKIIKDVTISISKRVMSPFFGLLSSILRNRVGKGWVFGLVQAIFSRVQISP